MPRKRDIPEESSQRCCAGVARPEHIRQHRPRGGSRTVADKACFIADIMDLLDSTAATVIIKPGLRVLRPMTSGWTVSAGAKGPNKNRKSAQFTGTLCREIRAVC